MFLFPMLMLIAFLFLQVLANLTSVQSYFDIFAEKMDQEASVSYNRRDVFNFMHFVLFVITLNTMQELEEAELEMDILKKEVLVLGDSNHRNDVAFPSCNVFTVISRVVLSLFSNN